MLPALQRFIKKNGGSTDDAHEVFQESILLVYKKVIKNPNEDFENIEGYLYQTGIHTWIKKVKEANRFHLLEDLTTLEKVTNYAENEIIYHKKKPETINNLFADLGEKCKEILQLSIYSELSQDDIMIRMGFATIGAVKMQYKRCKEKLIELLKTKPQLLETLREASA